MSSKMRGYWALQNEGASRILELRKETATMYNEPITARITCPKCGDVEVNTEWHRASEHPRWETCGRARMEYGGLEITQEHLHRTCMYCMYEWIDDVLSAKG